MMYVSKGFSNTAEPMYSHGSCKVLDLSHPAIFCFFYVKGINVAVEFLIPNITKMDNVVFRFAITVTC